MSYSEYISKQETYCKEHNYPVFIAKKRRMLPVREEHL